MRWGWPKWASSCEKVRASKGRWDFRREHFQALTKKRTSTFYFHQYVLLPFCFNIISKEISGITLHLLLVALLVADVGQQGCDHSDAVVYHLLANPWGWVENWQKRTQRTSGFNKVTSYYYYYYILLPLLLLQLLILLQLQLLYNDYTTTTTTTTTRTTTTTSTTSTTTSIKLPNQLQIY